MQRFILRWPKEDLPSARTAFTRSFPNVIAVQLVFSVMLSSAMWLPRENITVRGETVADEEVVGGYVLGDQGQWTTILQYRPREVTRVPAESVTARAVCGGSPWLGRSALSFIFRSGSEVADYETCVT